MKCLTTKGLQFLRKNFIYRVIPSCMRKILVLTIEVLHLARLINLSLEKFAKMRNRKNNRLKIDFDDRFFPVIQKTRFLGFLDFNLSDNF